MDKTPKHLRMNSQPIAWSARGYKMSKTAKKKMSIAAKRIGADPVERARRSAQAKAQHAAGNLGRATWDEKTKKKMHKLHSEIMKKHGAKGRAIAHSRMTSEEMSRRSYKRKIFNKGRSNASIME